MHDRVEAFGGHTIRRIPRAARAGIVEQTIEAAKVFGRRSDGIGDVAFRRDVAAHIMRRAFVLLLDPRAFVVLDVGSDDLRALRHEQIDRTAANAAGRARDDGDLSLQTSSHKVLPRSFRHHPACRGKRNGCGNHDYGRSRPHALDPIELSQALIRCPSVTPKDEGALGVLERALTPLDFACHRLRFEQDGTAPIENIYARIGTAGPNFCFAGHTDVVPPGEKWSHDPFAGTVEDGTLYGRGAVDMKSAIAAFAAAASRYLANGAPKGSISLLITGDEEGPAINGTPKMLGWLKERGETLSHCIVGEPTATTRAGDTLKIGRRGSITTGVVVRGVQGHVGYPHRARNPIPAIAALITRLSSLALDKGTEHFEPSTLSFTTVDVGNPAANVIPAEAHATFNIRFNDAHSSETLKRWIEGEAKTIEADTSCEIALRFTVGGDVFITKPGSFTDLVSKAVESSTGETPEFSTTGGTSDARFIRAYCPVAELGLPGTTMHKVDECVPVAEITRLSDIYLKILEHYFANPPR